uniref:ATPase subunit 9 n=1 Tax=Picea glauca TaxID=3330 RepID=A0A124GPB5_PICGL|nr:ATPase subunit 9 [Picea glauca]QHR87240.1 putative ATPase subunit 9 [Picea sitchensis]QHR92016.1 putative ATPase subunit 9 [Picea sitchensis]
MALAGAAAGMGKGNGLSSSSMHSVARNPSLAKQLSGYAFCRDREIRARGWLKPKLLSF